MRRLYLSILLIFCAVQLKAQSFEVSVLVNTGMSRYAGQSTVSTTFLNAGDPSSHSGYPNGDGNRFAINYGFGLQFQFTLKSNIIFGLQTGYETVSSKVNINGVYNGNPNGETSATGYAEEHNGYININPYIGYRFKLNKVRLDVLPGIDFAFGQHSGPTINVNAADGSYYNKASNAYKPGDEARVRLGLAAYYQKFGVTASYSRGTNVGIRYADAYIPPEHINVFRLGVSYRIK